MEKRITRRTFFKQAAKLLPVLALVSIPVAPTLAEIANDCKMGCKITCKNSCKGTHKGMCSTCSHACLATCKYTCGLGCDGSCLGSNTNATRTAPTNKRDSCKCECYKQKNDTILNK